MYISNQILKLFNYRSAYRYISHSNNIELSQDSKITFNKINNIKELIHPRIKYISDPKNIFYNDNLEFKIIKIMAKDDHITIFNT